MKTSPGKKLDIKGLYETFDLILTTIETKKSELKVLIEEIDKRIETLRYLTNRGSLYRDESFGTDPKTRLIIEKMLAGKTAKEIAIEEGLHQGEVELIINLYRIRDAGSSDR